MKTVNVDVVIPSFSHYASLANAWSASSERVSSSAHTHNACVFCRGLPNQFMNDQCMPQPHAKLISIEKVFFFFTKHYSGWWIRGCAIRFLSNSAVSKIQRKLFLKRLKTKRVWQKNRHFLVDFIFRSRSISHRRSAYQNHDQTKDTIPEHSKISINLSRQRHETPHSTINCVTMSVLCFLYLCSTVCGTCVSLFVVYSIWVTFIKLKCNIVIIHYDYIMRYFVHRWLRQAHPHPPDYDWDTRHKAHRKRAKSIYSFKFWLVAITLSTLLPPSPFVRDILHGPTQSLCCVAQTTLRNFYGPNANAHSTWKLYCVMCECRAQHCIAIVTRNKYNFVSGYCQQENCD